LLLAPRALPAQTPADAWVIWQSSRSDSRTETYRARADGTEVTRLTTTGSARALWSPDGRWIAYSEEVGGVHVMRPDGSERATVSTTGALMFWQHDNAGVVVEEGSTYRLCAPDPPRRCTRLFDRNEFPAFAGSSFQPNAMTHDNRYLLLGSHLYSEGFSGANGSFESNGLSAVIVDLHDKEKVYFLGSGCWPFSPPRGDTVFHICGDCPTYPDIYRMDLTDLDTRASYRAEVAHDDADWGHEYNPRVSNDNRFITYMSSTGCHDGLSCDYEIFVHGLQDTARGRQRVTSDPAFDGYPDMYVGPLWQKPVGPRLLLTPDRATFFASAARTQPESVMVMIKNDGSGALGTLKVTSDQPAPWLVTTLGGEFLSVSLSADRLTRGRHQASVTVTPDKGPPFTFEVTALADDSFPVAAADAGAPTSSAPDEGGCSCALSAPARPAPAALLLVALVAAVRARRRRSRCGPGGCSSQTAARRPPSAC
jgi:MYXO-CTERM domain-containing protein